MPDNCTVNKPNPPLVYQTSLRSLIRPFAQLVAIYLLLHFTITAHLFPEGIVELSDSELAELFLKLTLLFGLFWLIRPFMLLFDARYEVTANHVRTYSGRLSLRREEVHIPYEEVKGVRTRQTILERFLGIGDVLIWTGFNQTPDVIFRKVCHPSKIATTISDRVDRAILEMKNRPASSHQQSGSTASSG